MSPLDLLMDRIEDSETLEQAAPPVQTVARRAVGGGWWRDLLSGRGLGHPAHPAIVGVPAGAWTSALIMDLAGQPEAATTLIGVGTIAVAPAVLSGLSDWIDTEGAEQRVGLVHLSLNLMATAAYAGSWLARRAKRRQTGFVLSLVGATAASAAAWFGGHLAYAAGVGVDTNAFDTGPAEWTDLGPVPESEGVTEGRRVDGVGLAVVRIGERFAVVADRCSHRGGPLSEGEIEDGCFTCPSHGSRFDVDAGTVRKGPATVAQPVYETRIANGRLEVRRQESRALRTNVVS